MRLCFSEPANFFLQLMTNQGAKNLHQILFQSLKTAAETHRMLQEAFGDNAMSHSKDFLWYKRFKDGRTSVDDDEHSGRPSTSTTPENTAKVREAILADRRQNIHDVCEIVGLSCGTVQRILAKVWTWDAFLRDLCQDCWATTRRPLRFCWQGTQTTSQRRP